MPLKDDQGWHGNPTNEVFFKTPTATDSKYPLPKVNMDDRGKYKWIGPEHQITYQVWFDLAMCAHSIYQVSI